MALFPSRSFVIMLTLFLFCGIGSGRSSADGDSINQNKTAEYRTYSSPAYRAMVLGFMLHEANDAAHALVLPESLPITKSNLSNGYFSPPRFARANGALGNIATTNYVYSFGRGFRLSEVSRHFSSDQAKMDREYPRFREEFSWPMRRMDTNAAFTAATDCLSALSIDVNALNRDCKCFVKPWLISKDTFVPLYWVVWKRGQDTVAAVELLQPTRAVQQLQIEDPKYVRRKALDIGTIDAYLTERDPPGTQTSGK